MTVVLIAAAIAAKSAEQAARTTPAGEYAKGLIGGPHDFSDPAGVEGNACKACHVPHMQALRPTTQPATTRPALLMVRVPGQRRVFKPDKFTPGPSSLICLGCHDGTVAMSTIGSSHAILAGVREGFLLREGAVRTDHPIGVPYPVDRRRFRSKASVVATSGVRLPDGYVECVSCHDPHNTTGVDKMLVMSNRRSALCLSCHIK
jgi:predicted CXXCH cytochrome family protein